jgi:hypothetical protein
MDPTLIRWTGKIASMVSGGMAVFMLWGLWAAGPSPLSPKMIGLAAMFISTAIFLLWVIRFLPDHGSPRRGKSILDRVLNWID